jgi:hypothetical protein
MKLVKYLKVKDNSGRYYTGDWREPWDSEKYAREFSSEEEITKEFEEDLKNEVSLVERGNTPFKIKTILTIEYD